MYIEPNTIIKILHGCPLDNSYQHTIYFANEAEQTEYFASLSKFTLDRQQYQRVTDGVMRVQLPVGSLYDCNYLMFRNTSFSNRWFFAFITDVEYISNVQTQIHYELDAMQTWFFDYELLPSYVEREHAMTDVPGDNIVAEDVTSPICTISSVVESEIRRGAIGLLISARPTEEKDESGKTIYEAATSIDDKTNLMFPCTLALMGTLTALQSALDQYLRDGQMDAVMGVYPILQDKTISLSRPTALDGYTPQNKKLLTGQYVKYSFELAGNKLDVSPDIVPNPVLTSKPLGVANWDSPLNCGLYTMFLQNYGAAQNVTSMHLEVSIPIIQWAYNQYANSTALQSVATSIMLARAEDTRYTRQRTSMIDTFASTAEFVPQAVSALTSRRGAGGASAVSSFGRAYESAAIAGQYNRGIDPISEQLARHSASLQAPATGGSVQTNGLLGKNQLYVSGYVWTIKSSEAKRIDEYFTRYGYKTLSVKTPNRNGRPHWNYVKLVQTDLKGSLPNYATDIIRGIYERGITFWKHGDEVGNYSLDNSIEGGE